MFKRSCKEVTALVLAGEDRRLGLWERVLLGLHLKACAACPRFVDQVAFMRRAMGRWKQYAESDAG
jgi:hypothetical protein